MGRVRIGLLLAVIGAGITAGCGTPPAATTAPPPPPPTGPVGADGRPITNLCDLLTNQDFVKVGSIAAGTPAPSVATATTADCTYGNQLRLSVWVLGSADAATTVLRTQAVAGLASTEDGPMAGVDQSVYGTDAQSDAIALRRRNLVVRITLPTAPDGGKVQLIQLAATVLSRANALGT